MLKRLDNMVLTPLELTATTLGTDTTIHKKMLGSGMRPLDLTQWTTLIISNEEMNDLMKIIKSFQESCLLIKSVS